MVLADQTLQSGANRDHINSAFRSHNILSAQDTMLALDRPRRHGTEGARLAAATKKDLMARLGGSRGARLTTAPVQKLGDTDDQRHAHGHGVVVVDPRAQGSRRRGPSTGARRRIGQTRR
jgi:hypothetical protein